MISDEDSIEEIIHSNSTVAYKALVEKYQGAVFTVCLRVSKNRENAEEIAQDVFVMAFSKLQELQERNKFKAWLLKIAYSRAIDFVRKRQLEVVELSKVNEGHFEDRKTPLTWVLEQDKTRFIRKIIDRLPQEEASVISLYYLEEQTVKEIAEITGLSVSNVKIKLFRARKELKKLLLRAARNNTNDLIN